MSYTHDAIVIGAGAAGLTAAGGIALFGRDVALIEAAEMGGECLNTGCVPSKALLAAAHRAHHGGSAMGVTLGAPQVAWAGVHAHVHDAIRAIAPHDSVERFEGMGVEVIRGRARLLGKGRVEVGGRELRAPRIVLATGSKPAIPPIEGVQDVPYLTNENIFDLSELPEHLLIVGAGNIGMEMAQAFVRLGSDVTVIEPVRPLARDDEEAAALVVQRLEAEGVHFIKAQAKSVSGGQGAIALETDGGQVIAGSHLLIATGRRANLDGLGLEAEGVETGRNGIIVDARRRTSNKRIYAIGDCRDDVRLTHAAGYEGSNVVVDIALGVPTRVDYSALPWCTYTDPELGQVGMTEEQARERWGSKVRVVREGFDHNDRAIAEGRSEGFCKLVMKGRKLVGATVVGAGAGEALLPLAQVITGKASTFALGSAIIAYPTRGEIAKAASFAAWEPLVFSAVPKKLAALVCGARRWR